MWDFIKRLIAAILRLFGKGEKMSITTLAGTSWKFKASPSMTEEFEYKLDFVSNGAEFTKIAAVEVEDESENISYSLTYKTPSTVVYGEDWSKTACRYIRITGGDDADDADLIAWLIANAEQVTLKTTHSVDVALGANIGDTGITLKQNDYGTNKFSITVDGVDNLSTFVDRIFLIFKHRYCVTDEYPCTLVYEDESDQITATVECDVPEEVIGKPGHWLAELHIYSEDFESERSSSTKFAFIVEPDIGLCEIPKEKIEDIYRAIIEYCRDNLGGDMAGTFTVVDGYLILTYPDGTIKNLGSVAGPQGPEGDPGRGIVSITKTGTAGLVDTYTILYTDDTTSTYTVTNGSSGGSTYTEGAGIDITGTKISLDSAPFDFDTVVDMTETPWTFLNTYDDQINAGLPFHIGYQLFSCTWKNSSTVYYRSVRDGKTLRWALNMSNHTITETVIADKMTNISSGTATAGQIPAADGSGGISWVTPTSGLYQHNIEMTMISGSFIAEVYVKLITTFAMQYTSNSMSTLIPILAARAEHPSGYIKSGLNGCTPIFDWDLSDYSTDETIDIYFMGLSGGATTEQTATFDIGTYPPTVTDTVTTL